MGIHKTIEMKFVNEVKGFESNLPVDFLTDIKSVFNKH